MPEADTTEIEVAEELSTEETDTSAEDGDQFPRDYVEKLRKETAGYRDRAKTAEARVEELSRELFAHRVASLGKLADPADLPYSEELLANPDQLAAAVDALLAKRPHYAKRTVTGVVGQGDRDAAKAGPTFSDLFR